MPAADECEEEEFHDVEEFGPSTWPLAKDAPDERDVPEGIGLGWAQGQWERCEPINLFAVADGSPPVRGAYVRPSWTAAAGGA